MPATVDFTLTLAPMPVNFNGTPQEFATALVNRLTITPTIPWSSFVLSGSIPAYDTGPILYNAGSGFKEWRVWDTDTSSYTTLTVNGAALVAGSIPLSKLATDVANAKEVLIYDVSGVPSSVGGTTGQTLQMGAGGPEFVTVAAPSAPVHCPVAAEKTTPQVLSVDGSQTKVLFSNEINDPDDVYDPTTSDYTAPTAGLYFITSTIQIDSSSGGSDNSTLEITAWAGVDAVVGYGNIVGQSQATPPNTNAKRTTVTFSGLMSVSAGWKINSWISATQATPSGTTVSIYNARTSIFRIQSNA